MKDAARPRIHTFLATSDIHLQYKLHKTREEILKMISWAVAHAKSMCQDVEFSPEDAGRTDRSYLIECCHAAVEAGATVLNLPDTVGFCLEPDYEQMFRDVQTRVPGMDKVILSTHTHDDLGMAVANTLAGIRGGARQVEVHHQWHRRARRQRRAGRSGHDHPCAARCRCPSLPTFTARSFTLPASC